MNNLVQSSKDVSYPSLACVPVQSERIANIVALIRYLKEGGKMDDSAISKNIRLLNVAKDVSSTVSSTARYMHIYSFSVPFRLSRKQS